MKLLRCTPLLLPLLVALVQPSCDSGTVPVPAEDIAGLIDATAPKGMDPPGIMTGVDVELPPAVRTALEQPDRTFQAVVRVIVDSNGEALGVRVMQAMPEGSPVAEEYAAAIAESLWGWRFSAGYRGGQPSRGYLDLTFRHPTEEAGGGD